jgi:hypothetical protein
MDLGCLNRCSLARWSLHHLECHQSSTSEPYLAEAIGDQYNGVGGEPFHGGTEYEYECLRGT